MEIWQFWLVAGAIGLALALVFVLTLVRARQTVTDAAAFDLQVYRDQLAEVDRDLARGTLAPAEADRLRTEVSRRLLDADRILTSAAQVQEGLGGRVLAGGFILTLLAGSFVLYWDLGVPGYPDLPLAARFAKSEEIRAQRPSQEEAEAAAPKLDLPAPDPAVADLMEKLRVAVKDHPEKLQGQELLARNEAAIGNMTAARIAQEQVVALKGADATGEDHSSLAELMIMAAGGLVTAEAEAELTQALRLDPRNAPARYYAGLMFAQIGRFDRTFNLWKPLVDEGPADAPWIAPIMDQIAEVAMRAGVEYTPPGTKGPDAGAMAAAAGMSAEDRMAMIEGMVGQLSDRLATEGGPVEDWGKLITSLGVLGKTDEARKIYAEAKTHFAGESAALDFLKEAALQAKVLE